MQKKLRMTKAMLAELLTPASTWRKVFWRVPMLAQPRKDYWDDRGHIMSLRNAIAEQGQISAVEIVRYTTVEGLAAHLEYLRCHGETRSVADFERDPKGFFSVLAFGHCRTLANRALWLYGCDTCRAAHGVEEPGVCYARHQEQHGGTALRKKPLYKWDYNDDPNPEDVVKRQFGENTAKRVAPANEAASICGSWELARRHNPDLTREQFARSISRELVVVDRAIGYTTAPDEVKDAVEADEITFTVAAELGRLYLLLVERAEAPGLDAKMRRQLQRRASYLVVEHWLPRAKVGRVGHGLIAQQARLDHQRLPSDVFLASLRDEIDKAASGYLSFDGVLSLEEALSLLETRNAQAAHTLAGAVRLATRAAQTVAASVDVSTFHATVPLAVQEPLRELGRLAEELTPLVEALGAQTPNALADFLEAHKALLEPQAETAGLFELAA